MNPNSDIGGDEPAQAAVPAQPPHVGGYDEKLPRATGGDPLPQATPTPRLNPYLRARVISEWRGLPDSAPKPDRLTTAAEGIAKLVKSLGLSERIREEEVLSAWRSVVGDFIANNSQPHKLQNGVLLVQVLQPTMHYELDRVWKAKILAKLRQQFGSKTVRDIKFRVG